MRKKEPADVTARHLLQEKSGFSTDYKKEEPQTIYEIIKNIVKNPLDITNFIESSHKLIDILTDNNLDNGRLACDFLGDRGDKQMNRIQEMIGC